MLAALLSAAAVAGTPAAATAAGNCVPGPGWPADRADLAAQVVTLVNAHRAQLGLAALVVSPTLTAAAEWKARNMAAYGYLDHDDPAPDARTADERVAACGYPADGVGREHRDRLRHRAGRGRRLAGVPRAPGEHRAPRVPRHRRRRRGRRRPYWAQSFGAVVDAGSVVAAPVALPAVPAPRPPPRPPARTAPAVAAHRSATKRPLRVSCAQRGRGVACRVLGQRGTMVRIALMRSGQTFARARTRAAAAAVRVRLHAMRRLRAGRYALIVRAGSAAGERERRTSLVLR